MTSKFQTTHDAEYTNTQSRLVFQMHESLAFDPDLIDGQTAKSCRLNPWMPLEAPFTPPILNVLLNFGPSLALMHVDVWARLFFQWIRADER